MNNDLITVIANIALTLSFIAALIFGVVQVRAAARERRERLTLDTLRYFQTRQFAENIHFISMHKKMTTNAEMNTLSANDRITFIQFAQEMESLGILVAEGYINIDLVDKTLGSFVVTSWEKYKTMFLDIREKASDPFLGEYFQWLAEQIEKRMREHPRKPFFEK